MAMVENLPPGVSLREFEMKAKVSFNFPTVGTLPPPFFRSAIAEPLVLPTPSIACAILSKAPRAWVATSISRLLIWVMRIVFSAIWENNINKVARMVVATSISSRVNPRLVLEKLLRGCDEGVIGMEVNDCFHVRRAKV